MSIQIFEPLPHFGDDFLIGKGLCGIGIGQVVPAKDQSCFQIILAFDGPFGLQGNEISVFLDDFRCNQESLAGLDESGIFDIACFFEDNDAMGEIFTDADEPGGGLRECFEHQDTGHHGEIRKMILQILFCQGERLCCDDAFVVFQRVNFVDQRKIHLEIAENVRKTFGYSGKCTIKSCLIKGA